MVLDAIGLGVFAVAGCRKALVYGLEPPGAVLLGVITAIGGGVLRDIMAAKTPRVLCEDVYALAALAGAVGYVIGNRYELHDNYVATGAIAFAVGFAETNIGLVSCKVSQVFPASIVTSYSPGSSN